jgi:hypothetical protein
VLLRYRSLPAWILSLVLLTLCPAASAESDAQQIPGGTVMKNLYALKAVSPKFKDTCATIMNSLNRPKVVNPYSLWDLLVGTEFNYIWEHRADDETSWHYPQTVGDVAPAVPGLDRLSVDLDGDGILDMVYRVSDQFQAQAYSELEVSAGSNGDTSDENSRPLRIKDVQPGAPLHISPREEAGDFYDVDVLRVDGVPLLIAANSVWPSVSKQRAKAFVLTADSQMKLNVVCMFEFTKNVRF